MKKALYLNYSIATCLLFLIVLLRIFENRVGETLLIAIFVVIFRLRGVFIGHEQKVQKGTRKYLLFHIAIEHIIIAVTIIIMVIEDDKLQDWFLYAAILNYLLFINSYFSVLFGKEKAK
ncbi:MAG: hypothetical protein AAGU75_22680 [Bacillota bacterium]